MVVGQQVGLLRFIRKIFNDQVDITVISSPEKPIVGVGEGGILNFIDALHHLDIPLLEFMQQTGAVHKLGFVYEGWRTGKQDDFYYHMFQNLRIMTLLKGFTLHYLYLQIIKFHSLRLRIQFNSESKIFLKIN